MTRALLGTLLAAGMAGCLPSAHVARQAGGPPRGLVRPTLQPLPPTIEPYVSKLPTIAPLAQTVAHRVAKFHWSAAPRLTDIPDSPVTGMLAGRPFIAQHASVSPDEEDRRPTLRLRFSSKPRGKLCGFNLDDDSVAVEWHLPSGVGEWSKKLGELRPDGTNAWYVVEQADGAPFTRDAAWACIVRLEEVRGPTEEGGVESLIGRLAVVFDDGEQSWAAGRFVADGCSR